jgi:hypothetical protein
MANLGVNKSNIVPATTAATTATGDKRPQPKVWMNVGYFSDDVDPETGEKMFVSVPLGIGVDTMDPAKKRGRNEQYNQLVDAKNELLEMIQKFAGTLDPGQDEMLLDLQVQVRRVHNVEEASGANPHSSALSRLSFAIRSDAA